MSQKKHWYCSIYNGNYLVFSGSAEPLQLRCTSKGNNPYDQRQYGRFPDLLFLVIEENLALSEVDGYCTYVHVYSHVACARPTELRQTICT